MGYRYTTAYRHAAIVKSHASKQADYALPRARPTHLLHTHLLKPGWYTALLPQATASIMEGRAGAQTGIDACAEHQQRWMAPSQKTEEGFR